MAPKSAFFQFDPASQVTDLRRYSATTHSSANLEVHSRYGYDSAGRVTSITHGKTEIAAGEVWNGNSTLPASLGSANMLAGYFLTYDADNRVTSFASQRDAFKVTEKVSASGTTTKKTEYVYDAFDQRVAKRYDADGNGTWDKYEAFVWADGHEILRFLDSDGQAATQSFRVANRYLYADAVDQLIADEQYTGNTGPLVNATTGSSTAGNTLWALTDHLGSVRDVVDNSGVVRQHVVFDSFGKRFREVDYDTAGTQIAKTNSAAIDELFGYTGRDWDEDVGLQYNRARWYDPGTARWLSQDPIGFAAGDANLYRYVGNRPTNVTDPSGMIPPIVIGGGLAIAWFFFTPEVAAAPSAMEVELLPGIIRENQERNIQTSVSILTVPAGGTAAGLASVYGKTALARIALGGAAGGASHKLFTDSINECLLTGTGVSNYPRNPFGTAQDYGTSVLFWSGGMAFGEGYELLRPRFGNPQIVNLGGEFEPLRPYVDPSKVIYQHGPWIQRPGWAVSGNYAGGPPAGSPLFDSLVNSGRRVVISPNDSLPFGTNSTLRVYTNGCPVDTKTYLAPGIPSAEVHRILVQPSGITFGGQWYNNGYPQVLHPKLPIPQIPDSNE